MRPTPGCPHPPSTPASCTPARCITTRCTANNNPPNHYPSTIPLQRTQPPAETHPTPHHRAQRLRTRIHNAIHTARTRLTTLSRFRWLSS